MAYDDLPDEIPLRAILRATLQPVLPATAAIAGALLLLDDLDRQAIARAAGWSAATRAWLVAYDLPAVLVPALGIAFVFAGLWGLPALLRRYPTADRFELVRLVMAAVLLWGVAGTVAGWIWNEQVVTHANAAAFDRTRAALPEALRAQSGTRPVAGMRLGELALAIQHDRLDERAAEARGDARALERLRDDRANAQTAFHWRLALPVLAVADALLGLMLGLIFATNARPVRRLAVGSATAVALAGWMGLAALLPLPAGARAWAAPGLALAAAAGLLRLASRAQKRLEAGPTAR